MIIKSDNLLEDCKNDINSVLGRDVLAFEVSPTREDKQWLYHRLLILAIICIPVILVELFLWDSTHNSKVAYVIILLTVIVVYLIMQLLKRMYNKKLAAPLVNDLRERTEKAEDLETIESLYREIKHSIELYEICTKESISESISIIEDSTYKEKRIRRLFYIENCINITLEDISAYRQCMQYKILEVHEKEIPNEDSTKKELRIILEDDQHIIHELKIGVVKTMRTDISEEMLVFRYGRPLEYIVPYKPGT